MLPQVILLLVFLITFHSFSFSLISFLIFIPTRKYMKYKLKYMTRAVLRRTHFQMILHNKLGLLWKLRKMMLIYLFNNYLSKVNSLIMSHVPMKKLNKQQQKFLQKPWFTKAIQNYIQKKNKHFKIYIKC